MSEETALAKIEEYAITKISPDRVTEIIKENAGTAGVGVFDLDRITMPAGGGTQWEVPGLEGPEYVKELVGIVIHFQDSRAYWESGLDEGGSTPPDCSSEDGITGNGTPGGSCVTCPLGQFGSGKKGRGQACKIKRNLFLIQRDGILPTVVQLPVTSFQKAKKFFLRLTKFELPFYGVEVGIGLEPTKNNDGIAYSEATFAIKSRLSDDEVATFRALSQQLRPAFGG